VFSVRSQRIEPFRVMELLGRARALERAGRHVVHFEVGEPDFPTAEPIVRAGARALESGRTKYTEATGLPELRDAIAGHYRRIAGLPLDPGRVVVTSGASGALMLLSALLVDPGDVWLMTDPGYPCNRHFWTVAGGVSHLVPVGPETGFNLTPAQLRSVVTPATRGVLFASPANPTGAVLGRRPMAALCSTATELGLHRIVDEIYQGLVYEDGADSLATVLEVDTGAFVVNSFSKYFGMTGWRLGWIVAPAAAVSALERLAQNLYISPPTISQYAALAAFEPEAIAEHERRRAEFARRRDVLRRGLDDLGLAVTGSPLGAFYLYVNVTRTGMAAEQFCWRLLEEFGVAATPGTDFGRHHAQEFVRFAYTIALPEIEEGLARIRRALVAWGVSA
jgi:aspartate/methionine/tyrosine aminotransferase